MIAYLKAVIYKLGFSHLLDKLLFIKSIVFNFKANRQFITSNPDFALPPAYYLYETFQLNYLKYYSEGLLSAREIVEWSAPYLNKENLTVLEWGCGVARTCRHLKQLLPENSTLFACDVNSKMIDWNKQNITEISFNVISYNPPTNYQNNQFNLCFGISIFTHIPAIEQENWLKEIARILSINGIFIFSTHGSHYINKLTYAEQSKLKVDGVFTKDYSQKGHRLMSTYNKYEKFKPIVENYFVIQEFYHGSENLHKLGGQDLWIVKKK